jgi:hypothetical protein
MSSILSRLKKVSEEIASEESTSQIAKEEDAEEKEWIINDKTSNAAKEIAYELHPVTMKRVPLSHLVWAPYYYFRVKTFLFKDNDFTFINREEIHIYVRGFATIVKRF